VVVEAVAPQGAAVLNAADPLVAAMAAHCPGAVIFFAMDPADSVVTAHRAGGGRAVLVRDGTIVKAEGQRETTVLPLTEVPLTHAGQVAFQVENVLAATATLWALAAPLETVQAGLRSFGGGADEVPGRFNVFAVGGATVIVDYAHNPSAVASLVAALDRFGPRRRTLVFTGCDRRDVDLREMGTLTGNGFDRVVLYRDWGHTGRTDGELNQVLRQGLAGGRRVAEIVELATEKQAIETALREVRPGELLVLGIDSIEEALTLVKRGAGASN
jgi:cyanophycin synthetase